MSQGCLKPVKQNEQKTTKKQTFYRGRIVMEEEARERGGRLKRERKKNQNLECVNSSIKQKTITVEEGERVWERERRNCKKHLSDLMCQK